MDEQKSIGSFPLQKRKPGQILVLGIGNYLMGDEGVGVHLVHRMEKMKLPDYLDVLDGGTAGFFLMSVFDDYDAIVFVDATMDGQPAGSLKMLRPRFASDFPRTLSAHDFGLKDMIESLYLIRDNLPDLHLLTISVEGIQPMTTEMTSAVEQSITPAIQRILELASRLHAQKTSET